MTDENSDTDRLEQRLAQVLEAEADTLVVRGAWNDITARLLESDWIDARSGSSGSSRRRRVLGVLAAGLGAAAVILLAVWLGWRPPALTPAAPVAPVTTGVPRYDPSVRTLVIHRPTGGQQQTKFEASSAPTELTLTPERMRTESADVGRAALEAMDDVPPLQPLNTDWPERLLSQQIDVDSVRISGGQIRVELNSYFAPPFEGAEARLLAQAWVRTVQDTLGVRHDVVITLRGKPFRLYGSIDTTRPLTRDDSIRIVRPDGFDSPRPDDVVPTTFMLLGSATAGTGQPARVQVVSLGTGAIAYDWDVVVPDGRPAPVDFGPVLTLEPGQYRATLTGRGADGLREITFTVVA